MQDYLKINQKLWNTKTPVHLQSDFYDLEAFKNSKNVLTPIELELLGDIQDKSLLHLQCHFGQDTLSLARMGAHVTGIDLSDQAIAAAKSLAAELQIPANFINCDVYSVPQYVQEKFDIVFTTYGAVGWLPDMPQWADVIVNALKPGGELIFAEFHPVLWMFDPKFQVFDYSYFNRGKIIEELSGTYTDFSAPISNESVCWNHSLAEVMDALIQAGLEITNFKEYDFSPYNCFENTIKVAPGKFQIPNLQGIIPMIYSLKAVKK